MDKVQAIPYIFEIIVSIGILSCILFSIGLVYLIKINHKLRKYRFLSKDNHEKNLEELLLGISEKTKIDSRVLNKLEERFVNNLINEENHIQRYALVRFQAFENIGGDQSFALALLDASGNGIVLSSLFGRDEARVYCKPIEKGKSKYALSKEEQDAIDMAIK